MSMVIQSLFPVESEYTNIYFFIIFTFHGENVSLVFYNFSITFSTHREFLFNYTITKWCLCPLIYIYIYMCVCVCVCVRLSRINSDEKINLQNSSKSALTNFFFFFFFFLLHQVLYKGKSNFLSILLRANLRGVYPLTEAVRAVVDSWCANTLCIA